MKSLSESKICHIFNRRILGVWALIVFVELTACKKIVQIDPPKNSITTSESFKDSTNAAAAIAGIYSKLLNQNTDFDFGNGAMSVIVGCSSDELTSFYSGDQFSANSLTQNNGYLPLFWNSPYSIIYQCNASIEGLESSNGISQSAKSRFIGEAKFLRSFCYFYLINLFGDVPYITSTNYNQTLNAARVSKDQIFQNIINDLVEVQNELPSDYSFSNNERVRATKWAAVALLARVYLYTAKYAEAEDQSSVILNTSLFGLNSNLSNVFNKTGNKESILQWRQNTAYSPFNATTEGINLIPYDPSYNPNYILTDLLLGAFEPGDQRRVAWVDSTDYYGTIYYFPSKYKIGPINAVPNGPITQYYTVLRLSEQYLIRAEARAQQNKLSEAIADLNVIRQRAGLPVYQGSTTNKDSVLAAIYKEDRIEFFAEWGHRWLDLKRTNQIDAVMSVATPAKGQGTVWQSNQQLYPIPLAELQSDPNLTQNPGY